MIARGDFRPDDFDAINQTYFSEIRASGAEFADPSGWRDTFSTAAELLPMATINRAALGRYYIDEGSLLKGLKEPILDLISAWEARSFAWDEVTVTHSVSAAAFQVLVALQRTGIRTVIFETPGYAVTMNQARSLGLELKLIPTFRADAFQFRLTPEIVRQNSPCVVWITHPRMSLGLDQDAEDVNHILGTLGPQDYLVIDEATEQRFPSHLRALHSPHLIRLRGLLKGLGLNGIRISCALHDKTFRTPIEDAEEVSGGSLDLYSVATAAELGRDIERFRLMLEAASRQTVQLRKKADGLIAGSGIKLSPLVNGYIGCAFIDLSSVDYETSRTKLLRFCKARRIPVILGASMRFAYDPTVEPVRLNYFNRDRHIIDGLEAIAQFASSLRDMKGADESSQLPGDP